MNKIHRTVWNEVTRSFVAVAEIVRGRGRRAGGSEATAADAVDVAATPARRRLARHGLRPLALEQRFMFDGAAVAAAADAAHAPPDAAARALIPEAPAPVQLRAADPALNGGRREVAFVDTAVSQYQALEAGIRAGVEVVRIDGGASGLAQIARWAREHQGYDAIHLLSHGSDQALRLGTDTLTEASLGAGAVRAGLAELGHALKAGGDLLLYGCDVAAGPGGQRFISGLREATGADVAASTDPTGVAVLGGDWALEAGAGEIGTAALSLPAYGGLLGEPVTIDFESGLGSSLGSHPSTLDVTLTIGGQPVTFTVTSQDDPLSPALEGGSPLNGSQSLYLGGIAGEKKITFTVQDGYSLDLNGMNLLSITGTTYTLNLINLAGNEVATGTQRTVSSMAYQTFSTVASDTRFDGIKGFTLSSGTAFIAMLDDISLSVQAVAVNAAPVHTVPAGPHAVAENGTLNFSGASAIQVTDASASLSTTLTATGGTVSVVGGATVSNNGSGLVTITGTQAQVNAALASVVFTPTANFTGAASLQVQTSDGSLSDSDTIAIDVTDVKPVLTPGQVFNVPENAPAGTAVGTVGRTGDGNGLGWSITAGNDLGYFSIDSSTGAITVAAGALLNYEGQSSYTLTVAVDDEDAGTTPDSTASVTINLTNVNEGPTQVNLAGGSLGATLATAGAAVGTLTTLDPDAGNTFGYSLAVGNGTNDADNGKFQILGSTLCIGPSPLAAGTYRVLVRSTDQGGYYVNQALTITVTDNVAPTVSSITRLTPSAATTNADSVTWRVTFDETVTGVGISDFVLGGLGNVMLSLSTVSGTQYDVTAYGLDLPSHNGTLTLGLAASKTIWDSAGNALGSAVPTGTNDNTFTLDNTAPTITGVTLRSPHTGGATNADSLVYRVTFSEDMAPATVTTGAFSVSGTTASVTSVASVGGNSYDVTVSGGNLANLDGNVTLSASTSLLDRAGNALNPAIGGGNVYTVDNTAPTVASIVRESLHFGGVTNADSLTWRVTFSEAVSGVDPADFTLSGPTGATLSVVAVSATEYDVTASGGNLATYDGTATLAFAAGKAIADTAGNALVATTPAGSNEPGYTLDNTGPTITSITRQTAHSGGATHADSVTWRVSFSDAVDNVNSGDFGLIGPTGATLGVVAVSATQYDVTASGGNLASFNGTVMLTFNGAHDIQDTVGNLLGNYTPGGAADNTYTLDNAAPTVVSITRQTAHTGGVTNADSLTWRVSFSEAMSNVDLADFTVIGATGATLSVVAVSATEYDVTAIGSDLASYSGTATLFFSGVHDIRDAVGNALGSTTPSGANEVGYTLDHTEPAVVSITRQSAHSGGATNADSLSWRVTFSEAVSGVDAADFTLSGPSGAALSVVAVSATEYEVTASGGDLTSFNGTATLGFAAGKTIADSVGNALGDTTPAGANEAGYTLDHAGPRIGSITRQSTHSGGATNADSLSWRVSFNEAVSNVSPGDFVLMGPSGATLSVVAVSATEYDVTASGGNLASFNGTATLLFNGAHDIRDQAGNALGNYTPTGSADNSYTLDHTAPTVTSVTRQSAHNGGATNADSLTWRITFDEAVTNVSAGDFTLTGPTGAALSVVAVSATEYEVTASGGNLASFNGTVTLGFNGAHDIRDTVGNAPGSLTPTGSADNGYTLDNAGPGVVAITRQTGNAGGATNADSLSWRVTFSEAVSGVDPADFTLGGPSGATLSVVAVSATEYDVTASGGNLASFNGTATLGFAAGKTIADTAGNALGATTPAGSNEAGYTLDHAGPTIASITRQSAHSGGATNADSLTWRVTFNEAVSGVDPADFTLSGPSGATLSVVAVSATQYDVTASGGDLASFNGTATLGFAAGKSIADTAGNALGGTEPAGSNEAGYTLDHTGPRIGSITRQTAHSGGVTSADSLTWRVTFSEAVANVDPADFRLSGPSGATLSIVAVSATEYEVTASGGDLASFNGTATLGFAGAQNIRDAVGNALGNLTPMGSADDSYTLDNAGPGVAAITRLTDNVGGATSASSLSWRVSFSEAVSGLDAADFRLTGPTGATLSVVAVSATAYEVTASGGDLASFNGTATLAFAAAQDIVDGQGNALQDTAPTGTNHAAYTLDHTRPTVASITRQTAGAGGLTNADTLSWRVTFSEAVAGVDAADFRLTGPSGATLSVVAVSATEYDVTASGGDLASFNGEAALDFSSTGATGIADLVGNLLVDTVPGGAAELAYTLDNTAPAAPTLDALTTRDTTPVLGGSAEAGSTVRVFVGGATYEVTANGSGRWTLDTGSATPVSGTLGLGGDGAKDVLLHSLDAAGNVTQGGGRFTLDTTAPVAPVADLLHTADRTPVITGTAEPGSTVAVQVGGATFTVVADGQGRWSVDTGSAAPSSGSFDLGADGGKLVFVTSTDAAGNIASGQGDLILDTTAPAAPTLDTGSTNDPTPVLLGRADAFSIVTITVGGASFQTVADADGRWSLDTGTVPPMAGAFGLGGDGLKSVTLTSADEVGNTTSRSASFTLDTIAPAAPTVALSSDTGASATDWVTRSTVLSLSGTAEAGSTVSVDWGDGGPAPAVTRNGTAWSIDTRTLAAGTYTVTVSATDAAGNLSHTVRTLVVDDVAPAVAAGAIGLSGATGTNGTFKAGDTVTATWSGGADAGRVVFDFSAFGGDQVQATFANGVWSAGYTLAAGHIDATGRGVTLTVTDAAGNTASAASAALVAVDTEAPVIPDLAALVWTSALPGDVTRAGDLLKFRWEAGNENADRLASVWVDFGGFGGGRVQAAFVDGAWIVSDTVQPGDLDTFSATIVVTATDDAGNLTSATIETGIPVDNTEPPPPLVRSEDISFSGATGTNGIFRVGDTVTAVWAGGASSAGLSRVVVHFGGFGGDEVQATYSEGRWVARYTIVAGDFDLAGVRVSVQATDAGGQVHIGASDMEAPVDNEAPVLTPGHIGVSGATGTGGVFKLGDTVTVRWDVSAIGDLNPGDITGVTVDFGAFGGGQVAAVLDHGAWIAHYTIGQGFIDATGGSVTVTVADDAGNATTVAGATRVAVDSQSPTLDGMGLDVTVSAGDGAVLRIGDVVTVRWDASVSNTDHITGVLVDFGGFGGGTVAATLEDGVWSARYTVTAGSLVTYGAMVSMTVTDDAGNQTSGIVGPVFAVDTTVPVSIDPGAISLSGATGPNATFRIGDTVTAVWDGGASATVPAYVFIDFTAFGGGFVEAALVGGRWVARYTVAAGDLDYSGAQVRVIALSDSGTVSTAVSAAQAPVDNTAPVLTGAAISVSGATGSEGTFLVGDTVTVQWRAGAGGDLNADTMSGVTVDFSAFGGSRAVAATLVDGVWVARYTLVAGSLEATGRQVAVTARDDAGNATTVVDDALLSVDTAAPRPATTALSVAENAARGSVVGSLAAPGAARYELLDDAGKRFAIDARTGRVTVARPDLLDHESAGRHTLRVRLSDAAGNTRDVDVSVTVTDIDEAPVLARPIENQKAQAGSAFRFTLPGDSFRDPEGRALSYAVTLADGSPLPAWLRFDPATRTFSGTPRDQDLGALRIRVTARDPGGTTASEVFTLRVSQGTDAPRGGVAVSGDAVEGQTLQATRPDGVGPVRYQWEVSEDGKTWRTIQGATGQSLTLGGALAGRYVRVVLSYTDSQGDVQTRASAPTAQVAPVPVLLPPASASAPAPTPAPAPAPGPEPAPFPERSTGGFLPPGSPLDNPSLQTLLRGGDPLADPAGRPYVDFLAPGQPRLTQGGDGRGFRVVVLAGIAPGSDPGLMLYRGIGDQVVAVAGGTGLLTIPADAFAHTDPGAVVTLSARQANGAALPAWVSFDPATGRFTVRAAPGERKALELRVEARDHLDRVVVTTFKLQVGGQRSALLEPAGRPGLSAQLRLAAQRPHAPLERLDRLARLGQRA
ncbi:DUF4347 domain-containing protein [Azohydromonas caseinilytica]|uniref:DUF4347 domain-containing protein n=1 Tax=Azohydromonas caseinilytica TaxID=2728836 RepID=A0A848FK06_9BURK|nr:DUF4347 domain-containing protein [Azohydromonas caseinilytica]NML18669.1 DUF4347 domain-containing protein [Azohydromonas caseinilytica]